MVDPGFRAYAQRFMTVNAAVYAVLLAACALAWWPLDFVLFDDPGVIRSMATFRAVTLVAVGVVLFVRPLRHILLERTAVSAPRWMAGVMVLVGYAVGGAGTLDGGWGHALVVAVFAMVTPVVATARRLRLALMVGSAGPVGFLLRRPEDLASAALPEFVVFALLTIGLVVLTGHAVTIRVRELYGQERELESQRRELDGLARGLEDRVREQTRALRDLARSLQDAREEERRWMAHEMHDGLGQQVASLGYGLAFVRRAGPTAESGREVVRECCDTLTAMDATIAGVLERLRPEAVKEGLAAALEQLVQGLGGRSEVRPELRVIAIPAALAETTAVAAYRVVQEGVSNALKHARAARVVVTLEGDAAGLKLVVEDDGVGMEPGMGAPSGFGLPGIRQRVEQVGGTVRWDARPSGGTILRAVFPVEGS